MWPVAAGVVLAVLVLCRVAARPAPAAAAASVQTARASCTWYVSPRGSFRSSGRSSNRATTLRRASRSTNPGDVVCLLPGTYTLRHSLILNRSGRSDAWIVYRPYGARGSVTLTGRYSSYGEIAQVQQGAAYIEFDDLNFVGDSHYVDEAIHIIKTHHVRAIGNTISYMGSSGIATLSSDYVTAVGNTVYRFGDGQGWSSGISFNSASGAYWFDQAPGFHNVIADNIISGGVDNSSHHSDGNGIILDLGGNIAPTLIANNVVYMNGGAGIVSYSVSGKAYIVNNTLYKNGLDRRVDNVGELVANQASGQIWANNIACAWEGRPTYAVSASGVTLSHNASVGGIGTMGISGSAQADRSQILAVAPLFVHPPRVDPAADGQWRSPPTPAALGSGLALAAGSPLVDSAADPAFLPDITAAMHPDIQRYVLRAINGAARPAGAGLDHGAYER
jgi:Right handed beta helix region